MTDRYAPDPREPKLPKWVQEEIRVLRMRLREADRHIEELRANNPDSNVQVMDYQRGNWNLPNGAVVEFTVRETPHGRQNVIRVNVASDGRLYLNGDYSLNIHPQASNCFYVALER